MKSFTVVTDAKGELIAAQEGASQSRGQEAGLMAGPGQKLPTVELPEEVASIREPEKSAATFAPRLT
jgi:hypothetical protein